MDDKTIRRKVDSSLHNVKIKLLPLESTSQFSTSKSRTTRHYMPSDVTQHNLTWYQDIPAKEVKTESN